MMKKFLRMLSIAMALVMCFTMVFTTAVSAEGTTPAITLGDAKTALAGDTITIPVTLEGFAAAGIVGAEFNVDLGGLEYVSNDALVDGEAVANYADGVVRYADVPGDVTDGEVAPYEDGTLFTITATIPADAETDATYTVTVSDVVAATSAEEKVEVTGGEVVITVGEDASGCEHNDVTYVDNGDGTHKVVCACGVTVNESADHVWGDWTVTEATTNESGSKVRTCACTATETVVIPRKLKMNSVSLTLDSSIAVNFKANANHFTEIGYTDPFATFVVNGRTTVVTDYTIEASSGRYIFTIGLTPQLLNYDITYTLGAYYDGVLYESDAATYKMTTYCYNQLRKDGQTDAWKTLYVNLLNYGTAAQKYRKLTDVPYPNADLTEAEKAYGTQDAREYADLQNAKYAVIDNPTAAFKAVNVAMDSAVEIKLVATLPNDKTGLVLHAENDAGSWDVPYSEEEWTYDALAGRYTYYFDQLGAHLMDDAVRFTYMQNGEVISNTLQYSIETYVARNLEKYQSEDPAFADVLVAMMNYGDAANALKN